MLCNMIPTTERTFYEFTVGIKLYIDFEFSSSENRHIDEHRAMKCLLRLLEIFLHRHCASFMMTESSEEELLNEFLVLNVYVTSSQQNKRRSHDLTSNPKNESFNRSRSTSFIQTFFFTLTHSTAVYEIVRDRQSGDLRIL